MPHQTQDTAVSDQRELAGRVAIVTGSARNIGRSIALSLAEGGAAVVVNARASQAEAEETVARIVDRGGRAMLAMADLTDPAAVRGIVTRCVETYSRLDILVNNAAVRSDQSIEAIGFEDWKRITASILDTAFLCSQAAIPHLRRSDSAAIVNIGGVAAHVGVRGRAHVSAAKAGVAGLTRALGAELAADGITVNCVSPGRIETVRKGPLPEHFRERPVPLGRGGTPDEVAAAVRYLVGPGGRFLTGQVLHLNGGWHMGQ